MKNLMIAVAMLFATVSASAQTPETGSLMVRPMAGVSISNFGTKVTVGSSTQEAVNKWGFTGGAELGYQALSWLQPSVGLLYSQQGSKIETTGMKDCSVKTDYLAIPVLANFYVADGLALKAGLQPCFLLSAKTDGIDIKDNCNSFQLQIPIGVSYEYNNFVIDGRMNIPVTKVAKKEYDEDAVNNAFSITIGYNFEL